ncbi:MAG TPA: DUF3090 family protein [Micromonosporaceae bacterium]|jgi:uncharacterized repeat protein (TIGR03847 family)
MTHQVYEFEPPERFVAGTVGAPGERVFYLQARGGGRLVSVALEKVQVSLLAEKLDELLIEANRRFGLVLPDVSVAPTDNEPLESPIEEEFRVGTLGLAYDVDSSTVVIEAIAVGEAEEETEVEIAADDETDDDDDDEDFDVVTADLDRLRVRLTPEETRAFIERAKRVIAAGRPPCPLCGQPLDPAGHRCPRHNGYHR